MSGAPVSRRIRSDINDGEVFALKGNIRPAVESGAAHDKGKVSGSLVLPRMVMHFGMTAAQRSELEQLLRAQQDRRSPQYHQFLTPEEYAERFGLHSDDISKVTQWLESNGFSELQVARSKNWISFSGTAARAEAAFHIAMHRYSLNGESHFANAADPQLPKVLDGVVESIRGLHNFSVKPPNRRARPQFTTINNNGYYLAPDDWTTIYDVKPLYAAGLDGTGVTIAVVGQSDVLLSDIQAFRSAAGLTAKNPTIVVPPGSHDPGIQKTSGDESESDLDIEWAGAIARNADILFITASATSGNGVEDALTYAIDNNVAPIFSTSYGQCEADEPAADFKALNGLFQQANAQGMTVVAASGDAGAAACDAHSNPIYSTHGLAVTFPASSEFVTGVGGTAFDLSNNWSSTNNSSNGSALSYIPEMAWDDIATPVSGGSGGGASALVSKPFWQVGQGVPADSARDVPDLAFAASVYSAAPLICYEGSCVNGFLDSKSYPLEIGGTSAAAPPFAGMLALVIQKHGVGSRLGNINPNLYSLAQISTNIFHDITQGNNEVSCKPSTPDCTNQSQSDPQIGFQAGPGYDQVTGLGSLDAYNFAEQWYGDFQLSVNPAALTILPGTSANATITVSPQNNFSGPVTLTCSVAGALVDVTCSIPNATLNSSGTATLIISAANTANTPLWKRLRTILPSGHIWQFIYFPVMLLLLTVTVVAQSRKHPAFCRPSVYVAHSLLLLAIGVGAVSCGGAGSAPLLGNKGSAPTQPLALTLSCNLPASATTAVAYSGNCTAGGGTGAVTFSVSSGALPAGFSLNAATGAITGTPTSPGTSSFTIKVTDSGSPVQTATQTMTSFTVVAQVTPLVLTCNLPANANNGTTYSGTCSASGGTSPFTFSVYAGLLPMD